MKNHPELPESAPQWLLDADIGNPKVEIINGLIVWRGGMWYGGEWRGGKELAPRARWLFTKKDNLLKIGCKQKTIQEWKEWFETSDEVFESARNSERFFLIKEAFYKFCAS